MGNFKWFTDGVKTIKVYDDQNVPDGYYPGRTFNTNPWNKGLTKDTDGRVLKYSEARNETLKNNPQIPWNKGLTKETNSSLLMVSQKVSMARKGKPSWNKGIPMRETSKKLLSQKNKGKPGWNKGLTKETDCRIKKISDKLKGHPYWTTDIISAKQKEYITRRNNNTFNTSHPEEILYNALVSKFEESDIIRQYFDKERYPFKCDFYIKSEDLFIELHLSWCHGYMPFNPDSTECVEQLYQWEQKSKQSEYYKYAIQNWTDKDVSRLNYMNRNHLNYLVIYQDFVITSNNYKLKTKFRELLEHLDYYIRVASQDNQQPSL